MSSPNLVPGTLYIKDWNYIAWSQPGGPFTEVFPPEQNGPFLNYPVPGQFFSELSGLWTSGCGHNQMYPMIFRDFDNATQKSAAVICCPLCTFIQYLIEPYELYTDPLQYPIVVI